MRYLFTFLAIFIFIASQAQFNKHFKKKTCRIDYFHSGSYEVEYYTLEMIREEPGWSGVKSKLIDPFDYGHYKFHVHDSVSGELLYSRGYGTLLNEYQATEEARSQCGNFAESVVFPFPKHTVRVDFYSRNKDLEWEKQFEVMVNPGDPEIRKKEEHIYKKFKVHRSGSPGKKLDILFIPDGYLADQEEKFRSDCSRFAGYLLNTSPYDEFTGMINIWGVFAPSREEGPDIPGDSIWANSLLNSSFNTFGSERYLTTEDYFMVRNLASNAPADQVVILVNYDKYGGGGMYNFYSVTTVDHASSDFVMTHEFGHAFPGLGDEYYSSEVAVEDFYNLEKEPWEPNLTTLVDFESKWAGMLDPSTPVPTNDTDEYDGVTGVFEGGGYVARGVYRPYRDCSMNVVRYNHFCPVCKESIRKMIEFYSK